MAMGAGIGIVALVVAGFILSQIVVFAWFWTIVLPIVLVLVVLGCLMGLAESFIRPFIWLWRKTDPLIAVLIIVMIVFGLTTPASITWMVGKATMLYYSSTFLTWEFLAQYSQRQDTTVWATFKRRHRFRCLGFGLPIWAAFQLQPVVAVCLLQVFAGAAACLLADLAEVDNE